MRPTPPLSPSAGKVLASLLDQAASKAEYQRVLCVWLRAALAMSAAEIATALGGHTGSVHNLHSRYLHAGASALLEGDHGGRRRALLSREGEQALLRTFTATAKQGGVAEASRIRVALEQPVGHPVTKSTVYRLLARHGWRKLVPRPEHPNASREAQEALKKSSAAWPALNSGAQRNAVGHCT